MSTTAGPHDDKPYVGPRTYKPSEAHKFFGRAREQRDLTALIIAKRVVLFYAASGAGKSSLINTKVVPLLRERGFEVPRMGSVSGHDGRSVSAENIYVYNLISSLHEGQNEPPGAAALMLPDFLDRMVCKNGAFQYDAAYVYSQEDELKPRVLIIDQFEEILTTNSDFWQQREGFFRQLGEALTLDEQLWLVLALREDFVAGLDPYLHLLPTGLRNRYYMQPLSRKAALQAIQNPVRDIRPFESEAANLLVDNLLTIRGSREDSGVRRSQYVEPVQLQAVCYQMWEKLRSHPGPTITVQDVKDFADVDTALIGFYEQTIAETVEETSVSEVELRNWFEAELITDAGTRNMVFRGEQKTGSLATSIADFVLKRFILREVVRTGGVWYELIHDRFVQPILDSNQEWRFDQPLLGLAQKWVDSGRDDAALLDGRQLERLLETNWHALGPLVSEFVQKSVDVYNVELEAQRQREISRQRELAAEQRMRAEEAIAAAKRQRRLTRIALAVLALAVVGAVLAAYFGVQAWSNARVAQENASVARENAAVAEHNAALAADNLATAEANQELAFAEATRARLNEQEAERERQEAIVQSERALGQSLQNSSRQITGGPTSSQELALARLLALEGAKLVDRVGSPAEQASSTNLLMSLAFGHPVPYNQIAYLGRYPAVANTAQWNPDSSRIAVGSGDGAIFVWDTATGEPVQSLQEHIYGVTDLAWSPDGTRLASASCAQISNEGRCIEGEIIIWDAVTWQPLRQLGEHTGWVRSVAWDPAGARLASAACAEQNDGGSCTVGEIIVWDVGNWQPLRALAGHNDIVNIVAWRPDGRELASASCGEKNGDGSCRVGQIIIWNADSWEPAVTLAAHEDLVSHVAWNPDGTRLASASLDGTIVSWETESWQPLAELGAHADLVSGVAWDPDGGRLASASYDGSAVIWDTSTWLPLTTLARGVARVSGVSWNHDGSRLASAACEEQSEDNLCSAGGVAIWDTASWESARVLDADSGQVYKVAWDPTGERLASASEDGTVRTWNAETGSMLAVMVGHENAVNSVAWHPDARRVASGSWDGTVRIWDTLAGQELLRLAGHEDYVYSVDWHPDGTHLASGSRDGTVRIWDTSTRSETAVLRGHDDWVTSVDWRPDGDRLASASVDGTVRIWDALRGTQLDAIDPGLGWIYEVAWHPDGVHLALATEAGPVIIWDTAEWREEFRFHGHTKRVYNVAWQPDGERLASSSEDGTVRIWDSAAGAELAVLTGHPRGVYNVDWRADGGRLATSSADGTIIIWEIPDFVALNCWLAGRNMDLAEWQRYLPAKEYECTCSGLPPGEGAPAAAPSCG